MGELGSPLQIHDSCSAAHSSATEWHLDQRSCPSVRLSDNPVWRGHVFEVNAAFSTPIEHVLVTSDLFWKVLVVVLFALLSLFRFRSGCSHGARLLLGPMKDILRSHLTFTAAPRADKRRLVPCGQTPERIRFWIEHPGELLDSGRLFQRFPC
eukprot:CAMPEP_0174293450 /NCGR_PEP_ID=MMETSP0809-20121228/38626_1 /TAXON_ID=73025 ORGANISM="Eutreptiella gymnastica-like, Strain CCMP1594" /NCGR_SAMPLE_ID=MMETSP0809 /ASSEMBLY_ACC=CAM_ASM_000658 /LENGTH=152 /DNA_ID=CAMNT_0015394235 /DNA_START=43 /DNA_END=501 /DNA_ORIENTATION=-